MRSMVFVLRQNRFCELKHMMEMDSSLRPSLRFVSFHDLNVQSISKLEEFSFQFCSQSKNFNYFVRFTQTISKLGHSIDRNIRVEGDWISNHQRNSKDSVISKAFSGTPLKQSVRIPHIKSA